ncbi:MAG: peptidoglycan DD-metalloendopeptidase family protein [Clostridiales bacterium]|nr:peptidoglycan DD-metalloendopeptidase family protein [Clostridiales bacterium]
MKKRRRMVAIMAAILALLLLVPILITIISAVSAAAVSQSDLDDLKRQQAELQQKQANIENQLKAIENEQNAVLAKKQLLDEQINTTREEIENISGQILYVESQIEEKQAELEKALQEEDEQYAKFAIRVRAMEENGTISYYSVLFGARDYTDLLCRLDFIGEIIRYDEKVVEDLEKAQAATLKSRLELETSKDELTDYMTAQEKMQDELAAQIMKADEMMIELQSNRDAFERVFEENEILEGELSLKIDETIKELERIAAEKAAAQSSSGSIVSTGTYVWPSYDSRYITSLFGQRLHPVLGYYKSHNGVDIGASYGTDILAADSGVVVTSEYSSSYGNYIMIMHGGGRYTLYAHMSQRYSSVGDEVSQGETIGLVGSTGMSTGPHIHYEVYEAGKRVNPLNYYSNYEVSPNA